MTEPPLVAAPQPTRVTTPSERPSVGARGAGIALVATGILIVCVALALMMPWGDTTSGGAGGEGALWSMFAMSPWLYFVGFNPLILVAYAGVLLLLGVAVLRGDRRSLVAAVAIVTIEAVPSVLLLPMFGGQTILTLLPRVALVTYLIVTLRRQPAESPVVAAPGVPRDEVDAPDHADPRKPGSLFAGLSLAAAAGLALAVTVMAASFLTFLVISPGFSLVAPLVWWWESLRGPGAILAFALGWFVGSWRAAMLRGAVAAGVAIALILGAHHSGMSPLAQVGMLIGFAAGGAALGWLGHRGRQRGVQALLAALALPILLAVDQILFPVVWTGADAPGPGTPILLAFDAALAVVFVVRFLRVRAQHSSP